MKTSCLWLKCRLVFCGQGGTVCASQEGGCLRKWCPKDISFTCGRDELRLLRGHPVVHGGDQVALGTVWMVFPIGSLLFWLQRRRKLSTEVNLSSDGIFE